MIKLNKINRLLLPLALIPVSIPLYYPINRYLILPWLGDGTPYTDLSGNLVQRYFSANQAALIAAFLLEALTVVFIIKNGKLITGTARKILYFSGAVAFSLFTTVLFCEFSLWS